MKQKLLLLAFLSFTIIGFAKPKEKPTTNPAIGIMMSANNTGDMILYTISIKNTGEETLTNVNIIEANPVTGISINITPIPSLAPGEEITNLGAYKIGTFCYDQCQVMAIATAASTNYPITDLSSDPNGYDFNGSLGTYYNDFYTISNYYNYVYGEQDGIYVDANNNSIVDVGDVVNYAYTIYANGTQGTISDNNAVLTNGDSYFGDNVLTGIHYITQADVDLGYVYNSSFIFPNQPCYTIQSFNDTSPCGNCPNPNGANIITPLTTELPNRITGTVKFNANNDNCASGLNFTNRRINATNGAYTYSTYTDNVGDYHILIPNTGSYNTSALVNLNNNFTSSPASVDINSNGSGVEYANTDFCISSAANYANLRVNMININEAMPGFQANYRIYYSNTGSTNLSGTIELTFDNGKLVSPSALPAANSSTATTLIWNYTNLLPFQTRFIYVTFNVLTPPTVNTNDILPFTLVGNPIAGDNNPADNTYNWNQTVRSSFDPNDKTVIEGASIDIAQTGNYLNYVTRFQNTGTANATTVVIKETLDPKLDWNTFEPIDSSHTSNIQIRNENEVTYTFSNINLPYESANEPASHGWMAYRIKPKADIALWDIMSSKSDIYFDFNLPITTNTATTQVTALATAYFSKNNFKLYPNPATNYFVIETATTLESTYQIIDLNGKVLQSNTVESMKPIDISTLQSGFYFVSVKTTQGSATYKLIKN